MAKDKTDVSTDTTVTPAVVQYNMTVAADFGDYRKGDLITDPAIVSSIIGSENEKYVLKTLKGGN